MKLKEYKVKHQEVKLLIINHNQDDCIVIDGIKDEYLNYEVMETTEEDNVLEIWIMEV